MGHGGVGRCEKVEACLRTSRTVLRIELRVHCILNLYLEYQREAHKQKLSPFQKHLCLLHRK